MSQKAEKYARRVERRVARLEERLEQISHDVTTQGVRVSTAEELLEVMAVPTLAINALPDRAVPTPPPDVQRAAGAERKAKRAAEHARRKKEVHHQVAGLFLTILGIFLLMVAVIRTKTVSGAAEIPAAPEIMLVQVTPSAAARPESQDLPGAGEDKGRPAGPAESVKL